MKTLFKILLLASAAAAAASCAVEKEESPESVQERILKAFVKKYYPDAVRKPSGMYIIDSIPGTGRTPQDTSYVLVDYTITYLNGTYNSYTSDSVAKQLGTFTYSGYYDPRVWSLRDNTPGVIELLTGMREGGSVKAIVPATLLDEESGTEITEGDGSSKIYEIRLVEVIDNINQYQFDQIEDFVAARYPDITDSTTYGFYFHKYNTNLLDTVKNNESMQVRYIGRYLNGTVFDTNIEDSAKKYRIYSSGGSYTSLAYKFLDDSSKAMTENKFVPGFNKALYSMNYEEHAVTVFYSGLGYGDDGSGNVPGFVPLCFELWIEADEEEDE